MHGPQPGHQFVDGERFDQVIVDAGIKGFHPIRDFIVARDHQDRDGDSPGADALTDVDSTEIGKIPIKND